MNIPNRFRHVLTAAAKDRPVLDAVLSSGEAVADILTKDDLFSAVPVISTAFKTVKAMDSYRDRMFAAKLQAFLEEAESMAEAHRLAACEKLTFDDEGRRAAETLLLVLDKLTDMDKPALLGFLFTQVGPGRINTTELRRLASAIDLAFSDDLALFLEETEDQLPNGSTAPHREGLVAAGLTRLVPTTADNVYNIHSSTYFMATPLGELLHQVWRERL